jgi:anti-sigma factor RsiW
MRCEEIVRVLDGYVDGELEAESHAHVRDHVDHCAACAVRLANRERLGRLVQSAPYYPAPERLRSTIASTTVRGSWSGYGMTWAAAAAVLFLASATGVSLLRDNVGRTEHTDALAEQVVSDHVRSLLVDHLFDVESTDQHTVKPWFLGKLDYAPPVTDLAAAGFPLIGGRLEYIDERPVAALIYTRQRHTINLFVWPASDGSRDTRVASVRGFHVEHWNRDGMTYWAVSDLNAAELHEFRQALEP